MQKLSLMKRVLFSLLPVLLLFLLCEAGLRAAGFYYSDTPLVMMSLRQDPEGVVNGVLRYNNREGRIAMKKDARQLWVPVHSFEEKTPLHKAAGVTRIAALGDSCTMGCTGTDASYPGYMQEILNAEASGRYEVLNAGVGSHSSFQGLQRFKYAVLPYKPDIITIYFGWNDHWMTSVPDKEVRMKSEKLTALLNFLEHFRTYQAYHYLISEVLLKKHPAPVEPEGSEPPLEDWIKLRVSPADYRANLNVMMDLAAQHGMKVLLVTAPYNSESFGPSMNFPFPREVFEQVHEKYLEIVRQAAAEREVPLLDLAQEISGSRRASVLSEDGVHFSVSGCRTIAEIFVEKFKQMGWVS